MDGLQLRIVVATASIVRLLTLLVSGCGRPIALRAQAAALPELAETTGPSEGSTSGNAARHFLYILDPRNGATESQALVVDPDARRVVHTIPAGYDPQIAVALNGRRLYLTDTIT